MSQFDPAKVLETIKLSATALDKAEQELAVKRASDEKVAQLIPSAIDALIKFERVDPADREKAAAALRDPARVLEILIKTADINNTIRPRQLGTTVQEKKAGAYDSLNDPYVGRRTSEERESDRAYLRGLGIG